MHMHTMAHVKTHYKHTGETLSKMCPTSLRRDAQQVCLIFQTTAATSNSDRKQLDRGDRQMRNQSKINDFSVVHEQEYAKKQKNKTTTHQAALDGNNLKNRFTSSRNKRLYKKC